MTTDERYEIIENPNHTFCVWNRENNLAEVDGLATLEVAENIVASRERAAAAATLGRTKSPAKAKASRDNGKRGGRPRKPWRVVKAISMPLESVPSRDVVMSRHDSKRLAKQAMARYEKEKPTTRGQLRVEHNE